MMLVLSLQLTACGITNVPKIIYYTSVLMDFRPVVFLIEN